MQTELQQKIKTKKVRTFDCLCVFCTDLAPNHRRVLKYHRFST